MKAARVLVVGAGGIGCELLKNLVLTGLADLEVRATASRSCVCLRHRHTRIDAP